MAEGKSTRREINKPASPALTQKEEKRETPSKMLPRLPGVYQIRCLPTGKIYIGSSVNLRNRWSAHRRKLTLGKHHNRYLQEAWDRFGENSFELSILEIAAKSELLLVEQRWIDKTACTDRKMGFNISPIAGSIGEKQAQIWEGFIDPTGKEVTIFNLHEFSRQHNLDFPSMHRLAKGKSKLKSYKGWTHKNSKRQREYVKTYTGFIDPDGHRVEPITNLAAFCREHNLDNTHMIAVAHGRICSHRGWTHINSRPNRNQPKTYTGYINPIGQAVTIINLQAFCRANGLHPVHMHELKNGKKTRYKGWTWRKDNE